MSFLLCKVTCPYCGHSQNHCLPQEDIRDWGYVGKKLVSCCPDDGGCDETFVAEFRVRVECRVAEIGAFTESEEPAE